MPTGASACCRSTATADGGPTVEVAHEACCANGRGLRGWVEGAREDLRLHRRLAAATPMDDSYRDSSFLLRGGHLAQFESWGGGTRGSR